MGRVDDAMYFNVNCTLNVVYTPQFLQENSDILLKCVFESFIGHFMCVINRFINMSCPKYEKNMIEVEMRNVVSYHKNNE